MLQGFYGTHIYIYILVQDHVAALPRFIGSVGNLSLLTIDGYLILLS
jgi:hypothetical protein